MSTQNNNGGIAIARKWGWAIMAIISLIVLACVLSGCSLPDGTVANTAASKDAQHSKAELTKAGLNATQRQTIERVAGSAVIVDAQRKSLASKSRTASLKQYCESLASYNSWLMKATQQVDNTQLSFIMKELYDITTTKTLNDSRC